MTLIPYLLYLFLIACYEILLRPPLTFAGVSICLAPLLVVTVAVYKSELTSLWFGFAVGLLLGAADPRFMGWLTLSTATLGLMAFYIRTRLNLDSLKARLLLVFGGVFTYNIVLLIIHWSHQFILRVFDTALPDAIYTLLLAWVFFCIKDGRWTLARFKALF
ncbi:MAG: hypothetical protein D6800_02550 [Candidatus Zixiibacteriota bacterium]|nr:MAG: hypothetical protein D6800_02550 [candidate division Zixibacteria bacterium]